MRKAHKNALTMQPYNSTTTREIEISIFLKKHPRKAYNRETFETWKVRSILFLFAINLQVKQEEETKKNSKKKTSDTGNTTEPKVETREVTKERTLRRNLHIQPRSALSTKIKGPQKIKDKNSIRGRLWEILLKKENINQSKEIKKYHKISPQKCHSERGGGMKTQISNTTNNIESKKEINIAIKKRAIKRDQKKKSRNVG